MFSCAKQAPSASTGQGHDSRKLSVNQTPVLASPSPSPAKPSGTAASKPVTLNDAQRIARQVTEMDMKVQRLFEKKEYAQCEQILRQMIKLVPAYDTAWYNLACVQSRTKRPTEAVASLNKAVELGYTRLQYMERDSDLEALHNTEGFKSLLARREEIQRKRGQKIENELKSQYGKKYLCEIDHEHKLVFATSVDQRTLEEVKAQLTAEAKALWTDLFDYKPEQYLTVVIPSEEDAKAFAPSVGGFFQPETDRLIARQIGVTLRHEFTHAMHWGDQQARGQQHAIWVLEGLAGLIESASFTGGHIHPEPNSRLNMLQAVMQAKREMSWKTLFESDQSKFMRSAMVTYPESRYVMMYFYQKGKLRQWYTAYCQMANKDPSGIQATEKVFGKKLGEIEADWKKWVMAQTPPPTRPKEAYLGVSLKMAADGLEIRETVLGSGADKAGLQTKDVILKVDNQRIVDMDTLIAYVAKKAVGTVVTIEYRRSDKREKVRVTLGAVPAEMRQPGRP
jgi:tetratricopeptide (TPR) repeat protein